MYVFFQDSDDTEIEMYAVDFHAYDVSNAFAVLFNICQKAVKASSEEFKTIRNSCVARASEPLRGLIKRATDTHCLFKILAENNIYCNWMDVRFLKVIANACGNKHLQILYTGWSITTLSLSFLFFARVLNRELHRCDLFQIIT